MSETPPSTEEASPVGDYVVLGSAVLVLLGSFLKFYEIDLYAGSEEDEFGAAFFGMFIDTTWTAWSDAWSLFPLVALSVLAACCLGVLAAVRQFSATRVPTRIRLGSVRGLSIMLAAFGFVSVTAFVMRPFIFDPGDDEAQLDVGAGGWVVLAGLLGLVVGAILTAADPDIGDDPSSSDHPVDSDEQGQQQLTWTIVGIVGFVACWLGSFLPVLGARGDGTEADDSFNAWESFMRPVFGLPAILATVVIALLLAEKYNRSLGLPRLDLTVRHLRIGTSIYAPVVAVSLLVGNPFFSNLGGLTESRIGHYLMVVGAVALCAASIMKDRAPKPTPSEITIPAD